MESATRKLEAMCCYYSIAPTGVIQKHCERDPKAAGNLVAQDGIRVMAQERDERTNDNGRQANYSRAKVIELTDNHTLTTDIDSGFFPGLANSRIHQRFVDGLFASARESNLTTPRIGFVIRALDEKNLRLSRFLAEAEHQRNRGAADARFVLLLRRVPRDSFGELRNFGMIAQSLE